MKSAVQSKDQNMSDVTVDKTLNKLDEVILFPEKVEKARKTIAKIGLPKTLK